MPAAISTDCDTTPPFSECFDGSVAQLARLLCLVSVALVFFPPISPSLRLDFTPFRVLGVGSESVLLSFEVDVVD